MTLMSLSDCCRLLTIDPKTLRRWLDLAHVPFLAHPTDARIKGDHGFALVPDRDRSSPHPG